jgi:YHYH protein
MASAIDALQPKVTDLTSSSAATTVSFDQSIASALAAKSSAANTNTASGQSSVDITKLPIGGIVTNSVTTTGAVQGQVYVSPQSYNVMQNGTTGNVATGAWINADGKTYDATKKEVVSGSVTWPYQYTTSDNGATRTIKGNTLPSTTTGTYPIDPTTAAYKIDPNPNTIESENYTISIPTNPQASVTASPLGLGPVGVMTNGGLLYAGVDGKGNDANAYEVQDSNVGHPSETDHYHTHEIPPTLYSEIVGQPNQTKLVGYAADGYAIVAETGSDGKLLSTAQLDNFHGNTSTYVDENGKSVTSFHYTVSQDWPYTIGAFKGTPSTFEGLNTTPATPPGGQPPAGGQPPQGGGPPPALGYEPVPYYWDGANKTLYAKIGSEWLPGSYLDQSGQYMNVEGYVANQGGSNTIPTGEVQFKAQDGRTFGITVHYNQGPQRENLIEANYELKQISPAPIRFGITTDFRASVGNEQLSGKIVDSTGAAISSDGVAHVYEEGNHAPTGDTYFVSQDGRYFPAKVQASQDEGVQASFFLKKPIA